MKKKNEEQSGQRLKNGRQESSFKVKGVDVKECPFCCEKPILMDVGDAGKALMIECVTEGCVNPHVSYYDREFAVKLWNWRKPFPKKKEVANAT